MAKQSGLHQIRGKVGEHSYYSQTGVQAGLIRAINQAMSARVKNDEAYANTRLNNAEFGQACRIAAVISKYIVPKFRPMILPFSQAKLAKMILEQIKQTNGNWGERNLTDPHGSILAPILSSVAKNDFDNYGVSLNWDQVANELELTMSTQFNSKLSAMGADGCEIKVLWTSTWIGNYDSNGKYFSSYPRANFNSTDQSAAGSESFSPNYRPAPQPGAPVTESQMVVVILLPYRTVNSVKHTLQEYCTFKAFEDQSYLWQ